MLERKENRIKTILNTKIKVNHLENELEKEKKEKERLAKEKVNQE